MFDDTVFCNIIRILYHWRSRATCPFDLSMSCGHFAGIGVCHRGHRCECEYCLGWRSRLFFFLVIYTLCNRLCTINTVLWCENWINRIDIVTWAFEYCALFNACDRGSIEVQVMLFVKQRRMINDHFFFVYVRWVNHQSFYWPYDSQMTCLFVRWRYFCCRIVFEAGDLLGCLVVYLGDAIFCFIDRLVV